MYGPFDTPMHSVAMIGIVPDAEGRVLCIKRADNGNWEPPAGILELDEGLEACVEREVYEETLVCVRARHVVSINKEMTHPKRPVAVVWLCDYVSGVASPTDEALEARWLTIPEVGELVRPAHAVRIYDALNWENAQVVVTRYHDGVSVFP